MMSTKSKPKWIKLNPIWFEHQLEVLKMDNSYCLFCPLPECETLSIHNIENDKIEDTLPMNPAGSKFGDCKRLSV